MRKEMYTQPMYSTTMEPRVHCSARLTYRYEEAARPLLPPKEVLVREQFEPSIIPIKHQPPSSSADLRKPGILRCERGGGIALGEIEDEVEEGRDGAGGEGFHAGHGDSWGRGVGGEGNGVAGADKTIRVKRFQRRWKVFGGLGVYTSV